MTDITVLARLLNGAMRNVDLTTNTPVVLSIKLSTDAGATSTHLTKAVLDSLISNSHASGSDNQDVVAGDGLTGGGTGATTTLNVGAGTGISVSANAVAVDSTVIRTNGANAFSADQSMGSNKLTNLADGTNAQDAVTFSQLGAAVSGGGQVKISAADTTSEYLGASLTAGAGLSSSITNPAGNEQLDLAVNVDDSSIEINADALRVKAAGITSAMLAGSIDATKIADGSVTSTEFQYINSLSSNAQDQLDAKVAKSGSSMDSAANITFSGGGEVLGLPSTPSAAGAAASKAYVDAVALGLAPKKAVRVATTVAGTLASSFEDGDTIDGVVLATGDRILIKNQAAPAQNGIYVVQATGAPVRATDMDSISPIDEVNGAWVPVQSGTANASKIFVQYGVVTTIGTDALNFEFYNPLAALVGGDMITNSGSTFSVDLATGSGLESTNPGDSAGQLQVKLDGSTLSKSASGLKVAALGITDAEVSASAAIAYSKLALSNSIVAGDITSDAVTTAKILNANVTLAKLASDSVDENKIVSTSFDAAGAVTGGSGSKIAVQVDASTIEINTNALRVKDLGITAAKLAADSVTTAKILDANVTLAKLASASVDENKLTASVAGNGLTGGAGSALAVGAHADGSIVVSANDIQVASAPALKGSEVAGESFAATAFAVRMAKAADAGFVAGRVYKAAIDASSADNFYVVGLVNAAASAADPIVVTKIGPMTITGHGFTVGSPVFLDAGGALTGTAPSASNMAVVRVGMVRDANTIEVGIQVMGIN